jgi:aspartate aminotransferase
VFLPTTAATDHKVTPAALDETLRSTAARGLILCSPSNPTGATYTVDELLALGQVLEKFPDVVVFFDAIYDRIYYDDEVAPDLLAHCPHLSDRVITFNGFSKTYSMTGLRLGYAIGPNEIIAAMGTLQSQSTSNATSIVQYAALEALKLDTKEILHRRDTFRRRRDQIVAALRAIPNVTCAEPSGAFYAFPDFSGCLSADGYPDDLALAGMLLNEAHVAVVPGSAFGAPGHLRLSYALGEDQIKAGVERIANALA